MFSVASQHMRVNWMGADALHWANKPGRLHSAGAVCGRWLV